MNNFKDNEVMDFEEMDEFRDYRVYNITWNLIPEDFEKGYIDEEFGGDFEAAKESVEKELPTEIEKMQITDVQVNYLWDKDLIRNAIFDTIINIFGWVPDAFEFDEIIS